MSQLLTGGWKCSWYELIAADQTLTSATTCVAVVLGAHLNRRTGVTFVSRGTIARKSGLDKKTVDRAIAALEQAGYLEVSRACGRHKTNVYRPRMKSQQSVGETAGDCSTPGPSGGADSTCDNAIREAEKKATLASGNGDIFIDKRGHECRPNQQALPKDLNQERKDSRASAREEPTPIRAAPWQAGFPRAIVHGVSQTTSHGARTPRQMLIERLTVRARIDGADVILNLPEADAVDLLRKVATGSLTSMDVAAAHREYQRLESEGSAIQSLDGKETFWSGY